MMSRGSAVRIAVFAAAFAAVAIGVWWWVTDPRGGPGPSPQAQRIDSRDLRSSPRLAESPSPIRVVVETASPDGDAQTSEGEPRAVEREVAELTNLGPIEGNEFRGLHETTLAFLEGLERELAELPVNTGTAPEIAREAELLLRAETARTAEAALLAGSYVTSPSGVSTPLTLPGCEVLKVGWTRGGQRVSVTIIMPHDRYPDVKIAREYFEEMSRFESSERARAFNALPEAERVRLAGRIRGLRSANRPLTQSDIRFIDDTIGSGNYFDPGGTTVHFRR